MKASPDPWVITTTAATVANAPESAHDGLAATNSSRRRSRRLHCTPSIPVMTARTAITSLQRSGGASAACKPTMDSSCTQAASKLCARKNTQVTVTTAKVASVASSLSPALRIGAGLNASRHQRSIAR